MLKGVSEATDLLTAAVKGGIAEYQNQQKVAAQTNAVLKSTGGVANVSAKHVEELGRSLMYKSGVDDEAVKSGENVLLTFTRIRNEAGRGNKVFDQATKATLDLSIAMGKDLSSAAVMVGKALQDPVKGLTALQRVGVSFTQQQKDEIAALVDTGKTAKEVAADRTKAAKELTSAQSAQAQAEDRVKAAQDATRASSEALDKAQQHLADAHKAVSDASEGVTAAQGKMRDATDNLKDAQDRALAAQKSLTQARKDAVQVLKDLENATVDAQLAQRGSILAVQRAQENLDKVMADPNSTLLDKQEAQLALAEAQQNAIEAAQRLTAAQKENDKAQYGGIEKTKGVVDAKHELTDAQQAEVDAAKLVKAAQQDLAHAYDAVAKAQRGVRNALRDVADATRKHHDDQAKLSAALEQQQAAAANVAKAQRDVAAAQKETAGGAAAQSQILKAQKIILGELNKEFGGSAKALGDTLPGQIEIAKQAFSNWTGELVAKSIPALTQVSDWLQKEWPDAVVQAKQAYDQYLKPLFDDLYIVSSAVYNFIHDNWGTIGPIVQGVGTAVEAGLTLMVTPLKLIRDILTGDWSKLWTDFSSAPATFVKGVTAMWTPVGAAIKKALVAGLKGVGADAWDVLNNIGDYVAGRLDAIRSWGTQLGANVKNAAVDAIRGIGGAAWDVISNIGGKIADMADTIAGWGADVGHGLMGGLRGVLSGLKSIAEGIGEAAVSGIKSAINRIIDWINDHLDIHIHIPIPFHKDFDFDWSPHIPALKLAAGGVVTRPTLAVVGESGPEAVVPLDGSSGLGGVTIHYHGTVISERDAARQLTALLARERRRGNPAF